MSHPYQPQQPPVPGPPAVHAGRPPGTNTLAIVAFVFVFVFCPVSIVLGHMALGEIRRTGQDGESLAKAALILGYVFTGLALLLVAVAVVGALLAISASGL